MLRPIQVFLIAVLFTTEACNREAATKESELDFFDFFNPFYQIPQPAIDKSCIVDVKFDSLSKNNFNEKIDRIIADTKNGVLYSNPVTRDRVIYVAPNGCDMLEKSEAYFPTKYFNDIISFNKTDAIDHPYIVNVSISPSEKMFGDLENGAIAIQFDFENPTTKVLGERQISDLLCISNANLREKERLGLPFTYILALKHSILYIFNEKSYDAHIVNYLIDSGMTECKVRYNIEIRNLNAFEQRYVSKLVTPMPTEY